LDSSEIRRERRAIGIDVMNINKAIDVLLR
jgi:hypothetical protein